MSLTLQLSPELETKLREQAALVGKQPERIALDASKKVSTRLQSNRQGFLEKNGTADLTL